MANVTIHSLTSKTTPVDNDETIIIDSAASNDNKKITWANIKAAIKTYLDVFYLTPTGSGASLTGITAAQVSALPTSYLDTDITLVANSDAKIPSQKAIKTYIDSALAGLLDYRGGYDASSNVFPSSGGSGTAGAVMKGDMWVISVAGTLGGLS